MANRGGGGVLPNLVTPDGVDVAVARKRQYLAELQLQAEADRARKAGERVAGGGGGGGYGAAPQYPSPPRNRNQGPSPQPMGAFGVVPPYAERGNNFAERLKAGFDAALQHAHLQVVGGPEKHPDGPLPGGRDQGAEIMKAMRRWENMFTAQVAASMQAVGELNSHIVVLEEQLTTQSREKHLLRERLEHGEMAQKELQVAKLENESSLRHMKRDEQDNARRQREEMSELRESLQVLSRQQATAKVSEEKSFDDLRNRQLRHRSLAGSLEERVLGLEETLREANATIAALHEREALQSGRHSKALADTAETMASVMSRVKQVEERVAPDLERYVDKSNNDFWRPSRAEISNLSKLVEELRERIDQVDTSATALVVSSREQAAKERNVARDERVAQASATLSRFQVCLYVYAYYAFFLIFSGRRSLSCVFQVYIYVCMYAFSWGVLVRGGGLGSSTIFKKINEPYAPS